MFESLASNQRRYFPPTSFILKSEWNILGNFPTHGLKDSKANMMDVENKDDIT